MGPELCGGGGGAFMNNRIIGYSDLPTPLLCVFVVQPSRCGEYKGIPSFLSIQPSCKQNGHDQFSYQNKSSTSLPTAMLSSSSFSNLLTTMSLKS